MAIIKGNNAAKAGKTSLLGLLRNSGGEDLIGAQNQPVWDFDNAEVVIPDLFDQSVDGDVKLYMGTLYESFFITIAEGDEATKPIPFVTGAIAAKDIDLNEDDLTKSGKAYNISDVQAFLDAVEANTIRVVLVTALRDAEFKDADGNITASITAGDQEFRAELN